MPVFATENGESYKSQKIMAMMEKNTWVFYKDAHVSLY